MLYYEDYYAVIFAAGEDDDIYAEETWKKANPSLGLALRVECTTGAYATGCIV